MMSLINAAYRKGFEYAKYVRDEPITFEVSKTQHSKIMEVLGVKKHETKQEFRKYGIAVMGKV